MIEWLRSKPGELPRVEVGGQFLPVVLRRLPQARRITIRLAPDGSEVRVSLPKWGGSAEALAFVRSKSDWLEAQLGKLGQEPGRDPRTGLPYCGEMLAVRHDPLAPRRPAIEGETIVAGGPEQSLGSRLQRWLEGEALRLLSADLAHYCAAIDRQPPKLALSRAQRRWGSCSVRGTIRINWRLVMAPAFVRRSVVAHEVAHLVHFDHSAAFHALLDRLFDGDIRAANRWLKREGRGLYGWFG